jgi:hypothetical protein
LLAALTMASLQFFLSPYAESGPADSYVKLRSMLDSNGSARMSPPGISSMYPAGIDRKVADIEPEVSAKTTANKTAATSSELGQEKQE